MSRDELIDGRVCAAPRFATKFDTPHMMRLIRRMS
jgi:hypothetical protein